MYTGSIDAYGTSASQRDSNVLGLRRRVEVAAHLGASSLTQVTFSVMEHYETRCVPLRFSVWSYWVFSFSTCSMHNPLLATGAKHFNRAASGVMLPLMKPQGYSGVRST